MEQPWDEVPPIIRGVPWVTGEEATFFCTDLWHNWHNGLGKIWISCCVVAMVQFEILGPGSVDTRFATLSTAYRAWCRRAKVSSYLSQLTKDTFSFVASTAAPNGSWNKAHCTTQLLLFLADFCQRNQAGFAGNSLLLWAASWPQLQRLYSCLFVFMLRKSSSASLFLHVPDFRQRAPGS
jgi:hypothetical protein